jgi:hypothetical protein
VICTFRSRSKKELAEIRERRNLTIYFVFMHDTYIELWGNHKGTPFYFYSNIEFAKHRRFTDHPRADKAVMYPHWSTFQS